MKWIRKTLSLALSLCLCGSLFSTTGADIIYEYNVAEPPGGSLASQYKALFQHKSVTAPGFSTTLNYRLYVPEDYDPSVEYPVLLFLHGYGERGSDNDVQLNIGMMNDFFNKGYYKEFPCIIVAPQCPSTSEWAVQGYNGSYTISDTPGTGTFNEAIQLCKAAVDQTIADYSVDTDRLYVTGLSMGGYGTWNLLTHYPDYFAAAIPICGGADPSKASRLTDTPIWCFHGSADPTVPASGSGDMYKAITEAGGYLIDYTVWVGSGHTWLPAYVRQDVWDWLFRQNKGDIDTTRLSEKVEAVKTADMAALSATEKVQVAEAVAYAESVIAGDEHTADRMNEAGRRLAEARILIEGNLALQAGVTTLATTYNYAQGFDPENVGDNDQSTGWQIYNGSGDASYDTGIWVGYDFGKEVSFGQMEILWEDGTRSAEGQYRVEVSEDGVDWTAIENASYSIGTAENGVAKDTVTFDPVTSRYVRVYCLSGNNSKYFPKIYEISVQRANLAEKLTGDVDLSGLVDAADLTALARHVGGVQNVTDATALQNADIDGNGTVDAADLTRLARFVGGIE